MSPCITLTPCPPLMVTLLCLPLSLLCGRSESPVLEFNAEWLAITKSTHELLSRSDRNVAMPTEIKLVTEEDREWCVAS